MNVQDKIKNEGILKKVGAVIEEKMTESVFVM